MKFELIDVSIWPRKEYFDRYLSITPCSYSMTLNLDITVLIRQIKHNNIKLYPVTIYLLSKVINKYEEFRTAIDENGDVGLFDSMSPMYTIFQKDTETFTSIWTEYCPDFSEFYQKYTIDIQTYSSVKQFLAKPNPPANIGYFHNFVTGDGRARMARCCGSRRGNSHSYFRGAKRCRWPFAAGSAP